MLAAIETEYNGFLFRSRLEARWAIFFDALHLEYQYEPEGFDLNGTWYLPDFRLPTRDRWVEIKGQWSFEATDKLLKFTELVRKPVFAFSGDVWLSTCEIHVFSICECPCPDCKKSFHPSLFQTYVGEPVIRSFINTQLLGFATRDNYPLINEAFKAARQARFEHGKTL